MPFERIGDAGRGLRQHRADRPAHPQGERVQRRRSAGQAAAATAGRSPPSIAARCTAAAGMSAALATASAMIPASAPWRSSPPSSRSRKACSVSVAAANRPATSSARRAWDPLPDTAPISEKVASTSATVSVGSAAARRPRPQRRPADADLALPQLAGEPRHDDRDQFGIGRGRRSSSAMWATLVSRDEVPPTLSDVLATSRRSTTQLGMARPTTRGADALACLRNVTDMRGF